jgi:hypothetical protein
MIKKNGDGTNRIDPEDFTETSNGVQGSSETSNGEKRRTRIIEGCGQQGSGGPPVGKNQDEGRGHPSQENGCGLLPMIVKKKEDGTNRIYPEDFTETSNGVQGSAEISNGEKRIDFKGAGSKDLAEKSEKLRVIESKAGGQGMRIIEGCGQLWSCGFPVGKGGGMEKCKSKSKSKSRDRTVANAAGIKELNAARDLQKDAAGGTREADKEMEEKVTDPAHKHSILNRTGKTGADQEGKKKNKSINE